MPPQLNYQQQMDYNLKTQAMDLKSQPITLKQFQFIYLGPYWTVTSDSTKLQGLVFYVVTFTVTDFLITFSVRKRGVNEKELIYKFKSFVIKVRIPKQDFLLQYKSCSNIYFHFIIFQVLTVYQLVLYFASNLLRGMLSGDAYRV